MDIETLCKGPKCTNLLLEYGEISYYFILLYEIKNTGKPLYRQYTWDTNIQTISSKLGGHRKTDFCVKRIHVAPCSGKWSLYF